MLDFIEWCKTNNLELPVLTEKTHRSGIRPQYPDAYAGRGYAYPDANWAPHSATAFLDLKNSKSMGVSGKPGGKDTAAN